MTQQVKDAEHITPDAELQLIEDQSGNREIRCRSTASRAMVLRTREEIFEHITVLAKYANRLE
jgi:hypothetical protein